MGKKDNYNPKNLYVGKLCYFPKQYDHLTLDDVRVTEQKYIFEKVDLIEYKEIFSGIKTSEWPEILCERYVPYIASLEPIANYMPELLLKESVNKLELILALNTINFDKEYESIKEHKKTKKF